MKHPRRARLLNPPFTMNQLSKSFFVTISFATISGFVCPLQAQNQMGGISFVNAVGLSTPTIIKVNGTPIWEDGFDSGRTSLTLGYPKGNVSITATNGEISSQPTSVMVSPAGSKIVVAFIKREVKEEKISEEIAFAAAPNIPDSPKTQFRVMAVGVDQPMMVELNGAPIELKPQQPSKIIDAGSITITREGEEIAKKSPSEPGHFLLILYPDDKGKIVFTSIFDEMVVLE